MARTRITLCFILLNIVVHAQPNSTKVVVLEHSIRWMNESNFPYYLGDATRQKQLIDSIGQSIQKKFTGDAIVLPRTISYRVIDMFGKAKIKWPSKDAYGKEIAIVSSLTRETTGFGILWSMEIVVRNKSGEIYSKEVEHEITPISSSCYFTKQRWLGDEEFSKLFVQLVNEALGLTEPLPKKIAVGSSEAVVKNITQQIPDFTRHQLAVSGAMMSQAKTEYLLRKDSVELEKFLYKDRGSSTSTKGVLVSQIINEILKGITGINFQYTQTIKETRMGIIETTNGDANKLRLSWFMEKSDPGFFDESTRIVSPLMGELYNKDNDKESVYASFVYYKKLNSNNQELSKRNFKLTGASQKTLGVSDTHFIEGRLNGIPFEVVFPEQEGYAIISMNGAAVCALSLFNENPKSRSFNGLKLSENKKMASGGSSVLKKPDAASDEAEWYGFYTTKDIQKSEINNSVKLIISLFFSIGSFTDSLNQD